MPAKLFSKLKSLGRSDDKGLVKANLQGSNLPPEQREQTTTLHTPSDQQHSAAEVAGIASIHPDYLEDTPSREVPATRDAAQAEERPSLLSFFGRRASSGGGEEPVPIAADHEARVERTSEENRRMSGSHTAGIIDSLNDRNSSGHKDIQDLAEHYKGRSRRLAAAREVENANSPKEKAAVILDHQLMDIDSI